MVRLLAILSLALWLLPMESSCQSKGGGKTVILIDPGHGGTDSGAIGINGIQEKDIVFKIAREIVRLNESLFANTYEIYLTRHTDTLISLENRAVLARELKADLFVSLHCNHSSNSNSKGVGIYVPKKGKRIQESVLFAYQLQKGLSQNIGFKSRGVKFANFQVLRETMDFCPTVLVELGFLSNRDEDQYLTEDENVLALALSLLSGLISKN